MTPRPADEATIPCLDSFEAPPSSQEIHTQLQSFRGRRVAVALSGGVDSAVAAYLLKEAGAELIGLSLRLHDPDPNNPLAPRACCPPEDLQDGRRVAELLDFPFYLLDAREDFRQEVVEPFVSSYIAGQTPNPCVGCNAFVKLEKLARRAQALGCEALATGHYARLRRTGGAFRLYRGADSHKDQSYFLFGMSARVRELLLFPLGGMNKAEVRQRAMEAGLPVAHKLDSQEVCFIGGRGAGAFVERTMTERGISQGVGPVLSEDGRVLGTHAGVSHFTVGQRKGLGIAAADPLYVLGIDAARNAVTVGAADRLWATELYARDVHWLFTPPEADTVAEAKIRYRDPGSVAKVEPLPGDFVHVRFQQPVRAVAPGQAVVFYRGEQVLGGAWICRPDEIPRTAHGPAPDTQALGVCECA